MRDLTKLNADQRRQLMVSGDAGVSVELRLADLEAKVRELEKAPPIIELVQYLVKRIRRIEKKLKLPKYSVTNPLSKLKRPKRGGE